MDARAVQAELALYASKEKAEVLQRFFKTGHGQYAQGDLFLGVMMPQVRLLAKKHQQLALPQALKLLHSALHEERLLALLIFVLRFNRAGTLEKKTIFRLYLANTRYINNWDLVDLTAPHIVGAWLFDKSRSSLYARAQSRLLWDRRIAILATFYFIRNNQFEDTLRIARILLRDEHDLIHKAVGWMLREVGKRNLGAEEKFLKSHYARMPRTMLRYAIEKFPEYKRQKYLLRAKKRP